MSTESKRINYLELWLKSVYRSRGDSLDLGQIEDEIAFNLEEGLYVDWHRTAEDVYLCTQAPGCPIPPWKKVFAEGPMIVVDELLRSAG